MKTKLFGTLTLLAILAGMALFNTQAEAGWKGHWLYDDQGGKVGCKSPGHDCTWGALPV